MKYIRKYVTKKTNYRNISRTIKVTSPHKDTYIFW